MPDEAARTNPDAPRAREWLVPGLVAGAFVGVLDVVLVASATSDPRTWLALIVVDVAASMLAALACGAWLALGDRIAALPPGSPRWAVDAVLASVVSVPLGLALFSGAGIRRTSAGSVGPSVFPFVVAIAIALVSKLARRRSTSTRPLALGAVVATILALAFDRSMLRGTYFYLHAIAVLAAYLGASSAVRLALGARASSSSALAAPVLVVVSFGFVGAFFPHDNRARRVLAEVEPFASRVVTSLVRAVDVDSDRASPVFAGGDCNDWDAAIGPSRPEIPGNGVDEDCDGRDEPPSSRASGIAGAGRRRPYAGDAARIGPIVAAAAGRPTVVIVVDALRADAVDGADLPAFARLSRESVRFDEAFAPASSTALSIPSMITGAFAPDARTPSVFETLARAGHASGVVTIDVVRDAISGEITSPATRNYPLTRGVRDRGILPTRHDRLLGGGGVDVSSDARVTDRAFAILDGPRPPDLLWVHYFDLHQWERLRDVPGRGVERYSSSVRRVDAELSRWLARAERLNLVVVADHGEGLGARGVLTHTRRLWSELVRVPLFLRVPGLAPSRVRTPVSTTDLAPTLLGLVGVRDAAAERFSLLTLVGETAPSSSELLSFDAQHASLVDGRYRLVLDVESRATWLYEIVTDRDESHDLSDELPAVRDRMLRELVRFRSGLR